MWEYLMHHVVMFSGGIGSWAAAKRVAQQHGTDNLILLFTDTMMEDEDLYRFLREAAVNVGGELVEIADGRDPWQVFHDKRYLGNSRIDPCSRILKRELADAWLAQHFTPDAVTVYVGIDWTEEHRYTRMRERKLPWVYEAPLCEPPFVMKEGLFKWLQLEGIRPPRLYELGFSHNNCGGFCIKAGKGHYANLLKTLPSRYAYHEGKEQELRNYLGKDVSILVDEKTVDGVRTKKPLTLKALRERLEANSKDVDVYEVGGCGCFMDDPEDASLNPPT